MIVIGLILVAAGAIFGIDLVDKNRFNIRQIEVFGSQIGIHGSGRLFVLGAIVGGAIVLGLALIVAGAGRRGARAVGRRRERRDEAARAGEADRLRAENEDLRSRRPAEPDRGSTWRGAHEVGRPVETDTP